MNKLVAITVLSILSSITMTSFAETNNGEKTREQVRAELVQAQASGEFKVINSNDNSPFKFEAPSAGIKTRAQVVKELEQARKDGSIDKNKEGYDFSKDVVSTKTRAQVIQELEEARKSGELKRIQESYYGF